MKDLWLRRILPGLLALCLVLVLLPTAQAETVNGKKIVYGYSGEGRELCAYRYGDGPNVLVAGFAIHGFEGNFSRDGQALVSTAQRLMDFLSQSRLVQVHGWSVYVLPCMNPDGLYSGYTENGPGRCTTRRYDSKGNLVAGGVDLNRCFPTDFVPQYQDRYYTGPTPMAAKEAQALSDFIQEVRGSGDNFLIDTHGWNQQTIVYGGDQNVLYTAFHKFFPSNCYESADSACGSLIAYAHSLGYDACLFEMPSNVFSLQDYSNAGYCEKFISSIETVLKSKPTVCAGGHDFLTTRVEPTCTKPGSEILVCNRCGEIKTQTIPALGHTADSAGFLMIQAATATRDGLSTCTCVRCGQALRQTWPKVFRDVVGTEYFCDAVDYSYENGLIKGMSQDTFGPNVTLSRAMLVTILYRYAGSPETAFRVPFEDVPAASYYAGAVAWAYQNGIIKGITHTQFRPNDPVTRQQTATIFHRYVTMLGMDNGVRSDLSGFVDKSAVGEYAADAIGWCVGNGIMLGITNTTLVPAGSATRAQSAVMLYRVIGYLNRVQKT